MPQATERERAAQWWNRLDASREVYRREQPIFNVLEDAVAGIFPSLIPTKEANPVEKPRLRSKDQIDLNLMLKAKRWFESTFFDDFPTFRWSREPEADDDVILASQRLIEKLFDEGSAIEECKRAMSSSLTRGPFIIWIGAIRDRLPPSELAASMMEPGALVEQALGGSKVKIPAGMDMEAVGQAARAPTGDPVTALGMTPEQRQALYGLAEQGEVGHAKDLEGPHSLNTKGKMIFEATPYGTWCLWDSSVSDLRRVAWIARKFVMSPAEFAEEPLFKQEAKDVILARYEEEMRTQDGIVGGTSVPMIGRDLIDEHGRVVVWEIHDKVNWKRHYLAEGWREGFLEKDDSHPFMNEHGEPLFPNFFPCVIRVPVQHNKETPERMSGIPPLEPGWPSQVEFIKLSSAQIQAFKKSARVYTAADGADDKDLDLVSRGVDGAIVHTGPTYDRQKHGPILDKVELGDAPVDYGKGRMQCFADFANQVCIPLVALTGEAVEPTLGQENLAIQGSTQIGGAMTRCYESGTAELAEKALLLFRALATPVEMQAYLGESALAPRGDPMHGPKPSIYEAFRTLSFDGCKLTCRFAAGTRSDDAVAIKQLDDFIALVNTIRDQTGMPYFDVRPLLERAAKRRDIEGLRPYEPSAAEMQMMLMQQQMQQAQAGPPQGDRQALGGGRTDGRAAGGQRGPPAVPGRQQRHQAPQTASHMAAMANRPMTALS